MHGSQEGWKWLRKHSEKLKSNYFLSICRLLYCRAPAYSSVTQVNSRDRSLLNTKAFAKLRQGIWSIFLHHTSEYSPCFVLRLPPWVAAPPTVSNKLTSENPGDRNSLNCHFLAQSFALTKKCELFLHWRKYNLIYWMQVKLVDVVILLKIISECVCLGELKSGGRLWKVSLL